MTVDAFEECTCNNGYPVLFCNGLEVWDGVDGCWNRLFWQPVFREADNVSPSFCGSFRQFDSLVNGLAHGSGDGSYLHRCRSKLVTGQRNGASLGLQLLDNDVDKLAGHFSLVSEGNVNNLLLAIYNIELVGLGLKADTFMSHIVSRHQVSCFLG